MKLISVLPLAALTTAFVIPNEQVMSEIAVEPYRTSSSILDKMPTKDQLVDNFGNTFSKVVQSSKNVFDLAIESASESGHEFSQKIEETSVNTKPWLESEAHGIDSELGDYEHHGRKGHHHKPNMTVYQLISESKYTTKLAKLINEYEDLVTLLNGTAANYTIFAPVDKAFEKIPGHRKPSKEDIKKILLYHVSADFYPAGRVLVTHTIPTALVGEDLAGEMQRLSTNIGLKGLTVNFYSRIIAINIVNIPKADRFAFAEMNSSEQTVSSTESTASLSHPQRQLISSSSSLANSAL